MAKGDGEEKSVEGKKKGHLTAACSNCKKAHHSCDFEKPCKRCIAKGLQDNCRTEVQRKRGRKGNLRCGELKNIDFSTLFRDRSITLPSIGKSTSDNTLNVKEEESEGDKSDEGSDSKSEEDDVVEIVDNSTGTTQHNSLALTRKRRANYVEDDRQRREQEDVFNFEDIVSSYLVRTSGNLFSWMFVDPPCSPVPNNEDDLDKITNAMASFKITMEERTIAYRNVRIGLLMSGLSLAELMNIMQIVTNVTLQHNKLYHSLSPYHRVAVEEEFQDILKSCIDHSKHSTTPICVWDAFGWVRYVNPTLKEICKYPGDLPYSDHNLLFILFDFNIPSFLSYNKAWSLAKDVPLPLIVPISLQVWGYHPNYILRSKTGIDGSIEQYLDGTLIMDPKINALGFPVVFTLTFVPSPSVILNEIT
eukprot:TRINITY_DN1117_c0_g1_i1.p1 TRINITY_DN1117_c0_g1~~TRINITY_DN1117_c0_g1_i1.p1  ORF type:complete len:418 (-),score=111.89 TRINITY_DN1117_c0_g1_i1:37-1290(-)